METIEYGLLVFRQNDKVDEMDVHDAAYQRLNHLYPTVLSYRGYIEVFLNYSNNISLFKKYEI